MRLMKRKQWLPIFYRLCLHAAYLAVASYAGSIATFRMGVPAYGDSPGAAIPGLIAFTGTYGFLIFGHCVISIKILGQRSWLSVIFHFFLSLMSALLVFIAIWGCLLLLAGKVESVKPTALLISFVVIETCIHAGLSNLIEWMSANSDKLE